MTDKPTPTDAATPECLTCSDRGAVGNILTAEPCPDCTRWNVQPAPATQQAREVSDAMVLAALQMQHPAAYGQYLRHPANGPKTSIRTEAEIDTARRMIAAALAAAPQPSPTAQADSVQEDAARYRFIRDVPYSDDVRSVLVHQQNAAMDRVIDAALAARKQGANP